jgi:hypothetical protein
MRLQTFFISTSVLLILFSAGLIGHAVHEFNEANLIPALIIPRAGSDIEGPFRVQRKSFANRGHCLFWILRINTVDLFV